MANTYLFDRVSEFTQRFKDLFRQKKQIKALENYSLVAPFQHSSYLSLIKKCMETNFLGEKEADFLGYMLERYELNFLEWAHPTKWLKGEMNRLATENQKAMPVQLMLFDLDKERPSQLPSMPYASMPQQRSQIEGRI